MSRGTTDFDGYYVLLGIPPADQPPDNYRLLGLEQFESDLELIAMAADRQMGYLKHHESGDRIEEVSRLFTEVSRARLLLLNPKKKAAYDELLAGEIAAQDDIPELTVADDVLADEQPVDNVPSGEVVSAEMVSHDVPSADTPNASSPAPAPPRKRPPAPAARAKPRPMPRGPRLAPAADSQVVPRTDVVANGQPVANQSRPMQAAPMQPASEELESSETPGIQSHLWKIAVASVVVFVASLVVLVGVLIGLSQSSDEEPTAAAPEDAPVVSESSLSPVDSDDGLEREPAAAADDNDIDPEVPTDVADLQSVEISGWKPESPIAGDDVTIYVPAPPVQCSIEYRTDPDGPWASLSPSAVVSSRYTRYSRPSIQARQPLEISLPKLTAGTLQIEVRVKDAAGNVSPATVQELVVAENAWSKWQQVAQIEHSQAIQRVAFSSDGKRLSATAKQVVAPTAIVPTAVPNADDVTQLTFWSVPDLSRHRELFAVDTIDGVMRDDQTLLAVQQAAAPLTPDQIQMMSRSRLLLYNTMRTGNQYAIYALVGDKRTLLMPKTYAADKVAFSPCGRFIAVGIASTAYVWEIKDEDSAAPGVEPSSPSASSATVQRIGTLPPLPAMPETDKPSTANFMFSRTLGAELIFSSDGNLVCRGGSNVEVWDVVNRRRLQIFSVRATHLAFSADGTQLATAYGDEIQVRNVADGTLISTIRCTRQAATPVAASVAAPSLGTSRISSYRSSSTEPVSSLCFSPDGHVMAAATSNRIAILRITDGRELQSLDCPSETSSLAFSPDGTQLASGNADHRVRVWLATSGQEMQTLQATPPLPGSVIRVDALLANNEYGPALDCMQLPVKLPKLAPNDQSSTSRTRGSALTGKAAYGKEEGYDVLEALGEEGGPDIFMGGRAAAGATSTGTGKSRYTFTQLLAGQHYKQLHATLSQVKVDKIPAYLHKRFLSTRATLEQQHRQLAADALAATSAAKDRELENFRVYATFPDAFLPADFVATEERLLRSREKQALAFWNRAKDAMTSRRPDKPKARAALLRIVALKDYFPYEASLAEDKMRELGLSN